MLRGSACRDSEPHRFRVPQRQQQGRHAAPEPRTLNGPHTRSGALAEDEPDAATDVWEWNGGDPALLPFYRQHRAWFEALPRTAIRGNYLFVHAGVRPGVPLEQQKDHDLIWIRRPFLSRPHGLPYTVVHGHSITKDHRIDRRADRINLDTGAFTSGVLSSLRVDITSDPTNDIEPKEKSHE